MFIGSNLVSELIPLFFSHPNQFPKTSISKAAVCAFLSVKTWAYIGRVRWVRPTPPSTKSPFYNLIYLKLISDIIIFTQHRNICPIFEPEIKLKYIKHRPLL